MKTTLSIALAIVLLSSCSGPKVLLTEYQMMELTTKGRYLFEYDEAAWVATDTALALGLDKSAADFFVAVRDGMGWIVAFGKLTQDQKAFSSTMDVLVSNQGTVTSVFHYVTPRTDSTKLFRAAKALRTALTSYPTQDMDFNYYVWPEEDGTSQVFYIPAQPSAKVLRIGPDFRVHVSNDGHQILDKIQFHKSTLDMVRPEGASVAYHSHVLIDTPCETDVFYALRYQPRVHHGIICEAALYMISEEGQIILARKQ